MTVLGIDTSNYTTSLSLADENGFVHVRKILDVKMGECGLRQSDALFLHTVNLPELFGELFEKYFFERGSRAKIDAVSYSERPRDVEGSYMPCFLAGKSAAFACANTAGVPVMSFSHQAGHIMAALKSIGCDIGDEFLALHLSGGTTELLHVVKDDDIGFSCEIVCSTADISAGQMIDRAGVMLGLKFPCGAELEKLAVSPGNSDGIKRIKVSMKDGKCNLSGAENRVRTLVESGEDKGKIAYFVLDFAARNVISLVNYAREKYPALPVLFAGGVMRNKIIKKKISENIGNVFFASEELSSDNSVGTAYLGFEKLKREGGTLRKEKL